MAVKVWLLGADGQSTLYLFDSLLPEMPTHLCCSGTFDSHVPHEDDFVLTPAVSHSWSTVIAS